MRSSKSVGIKSGKRKINFTLGQALNQAASVIDNLVKKDPKKVVFGDRDIEFLRFNVRNGIHNMIIKISTETMISRKRIIMNFLATYISRHYTVIFVLAAVGLLQLLTLYCFLKSKQSALESFYGFDNEYLKQLVKKSERFLAQIQSDESLETASKDFYDESESEFFRQREDSSEEENLEKKPKNSIQRGQLPIFSKTSQKNSNKFQKRRKKKKGNFFTLGKRKRKGTLVTLFGLPQFLIVATGLVSFFLVDLEQSRNKDISITTLHHSDLIYQTGRLYVVSYSVRNLFFEAIKNPGLKVRGMPIVVMAKVFSRVFGEYNQQLSEVKKWDFLNS